VSLPGLLTYEEDGKRVHTQPWNDKWPPPERMLLVTGKITRITVFVTEDQYTRIMEDVTTSASAVKWERMSTSQSTSRGARADLADNVVELRRKYPTVRDLDADLLVWVKHEIRLIEWHLRNSGHTLPVEEAMARQRCLGEFREHQRMLEQKLGETG
jgi:hypothetical protein